MLITTNPIAGVTDANQNFAKVAKTAENYGDAVILRRNKPAFILLDIDKMGEDFINEYEHLKLKYLSEQLLYEYEVAYKALAK